jgi:PAS domain S-box-containing protein
MKESAQDQQVVSSGPVAPRIPHSEGSELVVVVDDQSTGRRVLERLIRKIGSELEVLTFPDAHDALVFMESRIPDLILTDYLMPGMDGISFIRRLRQVPALGDVPVIVVTVVEERGVRYRALDAGATDFLNRPVDEHECRARCRNLLTLRRQQKLIQQRARRLEASERRFRIMADELPVIIWGQDGNASVGFMNRTCCEFFGLPERELIGTGWQRSLHPEDRDAYVEALTRACRRGEPFHGECRVHRHDGEWRLLESYVRSFRLSDHSSDDALHFIGASVDITERKAAETALRASHRELQRHGEQLARLASQLTFTEQRERKRLAKILHDELQQLLVGASFGTERIRRAVTQLDDPDLGAALADVSDGLKQALTVSRTLVADLTPMILHEAGLPEALNWLTRRMRERYGLTLALDVAPPLSPLPEELRTLIFDAVREALLNTVKHAQCDAASVSVREHGDGWLIVRIEDGGVGFDTTRPAPDAAAGFGLFSMRERLRALGGDVEIDSRPGHGTRVALRAPLTRAADPTARQRAAEPQLSDANDPTGTASAAKTRILLVDDHSMVRRALAMSLRDAPDLEVVGEASDGLEAIGEMERLRPDVVLMDFAMPRLDGLEATRRIKACWPGVSIIGLSMYDEADRGEAMIEAGAGAYLSKTGDIDALLRTIRNLAAPTFGSA